MLISLINFYFEIGFSLQNHPENLDSSYKMDLDFWDCFTRENLFFQLNYTGLIYIFAVILER